MSARIGKIARLPEALREELNKRLVGGALGPQLLPWLNAQPETVAVLTEHFAGAPINPQNLSDWRNGGFREWQEKRDRHHQRLEHTRELARMSMELAQAGGGTLTEGAAAILGGNILEVIEGLEDLRDSIAEAKPANPADLQETSRLLDRLSVTVARLRAGDHDREVRRLREADLAQGASALALQEQKFQRDTCALFIRWNEDARAREIAAAGIDNAEKIERLGQLMFGEDWKAANEVPESESARVRESNPALTPSNDGTPTPPAHGQPL